MQRKNWTEYQDQILKFLKEDKKIKRWTDIAKIMNIQYKITGRNGKQCRERYHSHLERIFPKRPWNRSEQLELLELHSEIGNKWSRIAQKMTDRSDNNIKNHFYSKLRRAARKINKFISRMFYKEKKQIKFNDVYLIMEIFQAKFRGNCEWEDYQSDYAQNLKNRLFTLALDEDETAEQQTEENITLARDIVAFLDEIKKVHKRTRGKPRSPKDNLYTSDQKKLQQKKSQIQSMGLCLSKPSNQSQSCLFFKSHQKIHTQASTPKINLHQRLDEIDEISSLQLDNKDQNDCQNIDSFLESILSTSNIDNRQFAKYFEWTEDDNLLRQSHQLQNIITMEFQNKNQTQYAYTNMMDE